MGRSRKHYTEDEQGRKTFHHTMRVERGEFMLVGRGRSVYLWVGDQDGKFAGTLGGAALRQLAECILSGNRGRSG